MRKKYEVQLADPATFKLLAFVQCYAESEADAKRQAFEHPCFASYGDPADFRVTVWWDNPFRRDNGPCFYGEQA